MRPPTVHRGEHGGELVTIRTYFDLPIAEVDRGLLASHGIPGVIDDGNLAAMDGLLTTALGGVKLRVPMLERERAVALLAQRMVLTADDEPDERCPACGSEDLGTVRPYVALALGTLVFPLFIPLFPFVLPLALIRRRYCAGCKRTWKPI